MRIIRLSLTDFRNHSKKSLEFSSDMTLIVGGNGAGKTNILEAIHLLARGESWRAEDAGEMVGFKSEVAHVEGDVCDSTTRVSQVGQLAYHDFTVGINSGLSEAPIRGSVIKFRNHSDSASIPSKQSDLVTEHLQIALTRGVVGGERVAKAKYLVDGVARRKGDFVGHLKVVLFEPESLEIVIGDPADRRRFLDEALSQTNQEYARSLGVYHKALRTRNRLLQAIRDGKAKAESLEYWEREMVKHGMAIQEKRRRMVEWLDGQMVEISIKYDASVMGEERLEQYREREIAAGFTLVGPQRDDFGISSIGGGSEARIGKRQTSSVADDSSQPTHETSLANAAASHFPLSAFGSRGEQRMAVLKLKLLEAEWIEKETGDSPVILLDDIFSELDQEHDQMVGELVAGRQTIITATEISKDYKENATKIIELS